ncbi:hypothetical protein Tco_0505864 [Tanacetum coccineum]
MQDKNIAISELKKLIENCKGKSMETQFDKPSVVRQPNAQRIPKPSVLGKPTPFSNSPEMRSFQTNKSVNKTNASDGLFKLVTQQNLPRNRNQAIVQLILFIVDSGCTKHMTGNLKLLCNFVEKFLADQASVFMEMMSDHNSSDLAPQRQEMVSAENNTSGPPRFHHDASDHKSSRPRTTRQEMNSDSKTTDERQVQSLGSKSHGSLDQSDSYITTELELYSTIYSKAEDKQVVRLGINSMIQPEPEDLPKDNPKLEIAVLSMSMLVKVIRSQDGIDDKDNDKGSKSRSVTLKGTTFIKHEDKDQEHSSLNDKSNLTDLMKECHQ